MQDGLRSIAATADALVLDDVKPPLKLSKEQKQVQQMIGCLKYPEKVMPAITLPLHRLSRVMSNPPPEAMTVAKATLAYAYHNRHQGITYGGGGLASASRLHGSLFADFDLNGRAPKELEATADATWKLYDTYGILISYAGAAVYHVAKRIAVAANSSMEQEAIATVKAAETFAYLREVQHALGVPPSGPTYIATDNKANMLIAARSGSAAHCKHFLRRYVTLRQRCDAGEIAVGHIAEGSNPSDFLTKWVPQKKIKASLLYATNATAQPATP